MTFALALVFGAGAADFDAASGFTTGVNFNAMTAGKSLDAATPEGGTGTMPEGVYWLYRGGEREVTNAVVTAYDGVPGDKYLRLSLDADDRLRRFALPVTNDVSGAVVPSNAWIRTASYDGICVDLKARFTYGETNTVIAVDDKLTFEFAAQSESGGRATTNLVISAGYFNGSFNRLKDNDFTVKSPAVKPGEWHRLTVCVHSSATVNADEAPYFTVYIDETPVAATEESYPAANGYREDLLTPNARVLIAERRLFAFAVHNGADASSYVNGLVLGGAGDVDDLSFSTDIPDFAKDESVFTLRWDGGLKSFDCVVSNHTAELARRHFVQSATPRYFDFALGADRYAKVSVANVVSDAEHGYDGFRCEAVAECEIEGENSFVYDKAGDAANPVGAVRSKRADGCITVGGGSGAYSTFAEAIAAAKDKGGHLIVLGGDVEIGVGEGPDAGDGGKLVIADDYGITLDLNGHTLRGCDVISPTILVRGEGKLEIIDSVGGGAVLPPANALKGLRSVVLDRKAEPTEIPELTIGGGRYEGEVCVTGKNDNTLGKLVVDGGSFTNLDGSAGFYLEQYVTNATAYYSCTGGYWSKSLDGFIWCGEGGDGKWTTAGNWRCKAVPTAKDQVIFPHATDAWAVDYGSGVENPTNYLMDADVTMSGTAEFGHVKVSGTGLFYGKGTMLYTGKLPVTPNLADDWAGLVRISKITATSVLDKLDNWGKAGSKVEFRGVRGYVKDTRNHSMPYELVLTDDREGGEAVATAWKNETGYTGSTVSFAKLSGSGTLESPRNTRVVNQVLKFADVEKFYGKFIVGGKRVLLGSGAPGTAGKAGSITFSDGVVVCGKLGWQGDSAVFGKTLTVLGTVGDVIVTYTGDTAPEVDAVAVTTIFTGNTNECHLVVNAELKQVVVAEGPVASRSLISINGLSVSASEAAAQVKSGSTIEIPPGSAVSIQGNEILVNGNVVATIAEYYLVNGEDGTFLVALNEEKVQPTLAEFTLEDGVKIGESIPGLTYRLQSASSPLGPWQDGVAKDGTGGEIVFEIPQGGEGSAFYRVVVTDQP